MAKGIIYITTTIVDGLIKIGKTRTDNFEARMYQLEHNGYCNVTGLKRRFAIEVDDYDEKEHLLHTIFEKSNIVGTELFALDVNIAIQLLSSFEGTVVYPKTESKDDIFDNAVESSNSKNIPDGIYTFVRKVRDGSSVDAKVSITDGKWTLLKGSVISIETDGSRPNNVNACRALLVFDNNGNLQEDAELGECTPSFAGCVVLGKANNGWMSWKNKDGQPMDIYRKMIVMNKKEVVD